jgi:hypothetical protein
MLLGGSHLLLQGVGWLTPPEEAVMPAATRRNYQQAVAITLGALL